MRTVKLPSTREIESVPVTIRVDDMGYFGYEFPDPAEPGKIISQTPTYSTLNEAYEAVDQRLKEAKAVAGLAGSLSYLVYNAGNRYSSGGLPVYFTDAGTVFQGHRDGAWFFDRTRIPPDLITSMKPGDLKVLEYLAVGPEYVVVLYAHLKTDSDGPRAIDTAIADIVGDTYEAAISAAVRAATDTLLADNAALIRAAVAGAVERTGE